VIDDRTPAQRREIAFHEAGHTIAALAEALLESEEVTGDEVVELIKTTEERQRELLRALPPIAEEQIEQFAKTKRARSIGRREVADFALT
jgi:hypothetical protein